MLRLFGIRDSGLARRVRIAFGSFSVGDIVERLPFSRARLRRLFALYVAAYTVGRAWIEALRVDHANYILGLRLNDWTSLIIFLAAAVYLGKRHGRWRSF